MGKIKLKVKNIWNYALYCENGVFWEVRGDACEKKKCVLCKKQIIPYYYYDPKSKSSLCFNCIEFIKEG